MKNLAIAAASLLFLAAGSSFAQSYTVYSDGSGYATCDDVRNGGRPGGQLQECDDIGQGNAHSCDQVGNGCIAREYNGNNGNARCAAQCFAYGRRPEPPRRPQPPPPPPRQPDPPPRQRTFNVPYYGQDLTRCDDPRTGGRPGAQAVDCRDIASGKNHHCENRGSGCLAIEGKGNGGNKACDAICN